MDTSKKSLQNIKNKIKSKKHLYEFISQVYQLPSLHCKANTIPYLKSYLSDPCPFFRILRTNFHPPYLSVKHFTVPELLSKVEQLLVRKGEKPTGMSSTKLPDMEWLLGVYHFLSPNDEMNMFPRSIKPESQVQLKLDPE